MEVRLGCIMVLSLKRPRKEKAFCDVEVRFIFMCMSLLYVYAVHIYFKCMSFLYVLHVHILCLKPEEASDPLELG